MKVKVVSGIVLILLLIGTLTSAFDIQQAKAQEEGLVAYYPFNGNADDESGNNHDGTVNGATLTTDRFGNPNGAYSFDGSNDYVEIPHDADFNFGTGAFTVSAWINTNATTTSGSGRDEILSKGDATISGFAISMENNKAAFWVGPSGELFGSSVLNDGEWHQIIGTRDHSGNVTLYVDGMIESAGINNQNVNTTYNLFIGKHGTMSESYFDGFIDDVRIHNRAVTPHGVFLSPSSQVSYDLPGTTVSYTLEVMNRMGVDDSFDLSVSGNAWPTSLSIGNTGTIGDGESVSFTISVAIPSSVSPGDTDTTTVTVTSVSDPNMTDTAAVTTTATSGEYAYVAVSPYDYVALVDRAINQVVGTINVGVSGGHWPWRIAIEPGGQYAYVSCRDSDNIVVIDRDGNSVFTVISDPALNRPHGIAFTYDGAYALFGSRDTSQVAVVDTSTYAVVETIAVFSSPTSIATSPTGTYAYVTSRWSSNFYVIDLDSMSVVDTIQVGSNPWDVVLSPGGELAYVTNRGSSTVSVIDTSTNLVIHTISVGGEPHGLEISPDGSYLYVAGGWSGAVHVIDCTTNTVVANLGIWPGSFDFAWDVAATCEGDFIYVTNSKNVHDADGLQVCCINTSTNFIVATISMPDSDGDGYPDWGARGLAICHARAFEHELIVSLEAPDYLEPSDSSLLEATVYNRGLSNETNVELYLLINGTAVTSATIPKLLTGESYAINYSWTPTVEATYNVTAYTPPMLGENITVNNLKSRMVYVRYIEVALISDYSELLTITAILDLMGIGYDIYNDNSIYLYTEDLELLLNYKTVIFYTDYRHINSNEYTALESYLSSGGNLLITGFDSLVSDDLLRDLVRSATMGDNVGEPDLYVVDETHPIMNGPYGSFLAGYHISGLYDDCDAVEADTARIAVTVAELWDGYDKIIATEGLPGKVVYWNGVGPEDWMWNVDCEVIFKNTLAWFLTQYEHELAVRLDAPTFLKPSESSLLNATVYNRGSSNETSVELFLLINGTLIDHVTIPELLSGSFYTLSHLWTSTVEGIYNVTAYAPPLPDETITINNIATKMVDVSTGAYNPAADIQDPNSQMYMDQLWYNFTSPPAKAGDKFLVNVYAYNISKLYAYQVVLVYNRSVLDCTNAWPNNGWDDPNWVFYDRELGMTAWQHVEEQPSAGYNAEMVSDMLDTFENISLVDTEVLMARFEFEILVDPPSYGELMTVLDLANPFFGGTAYAYAEIPITVISSYLINSNYDIKWVSPPEYTLTIYSSPSGVTFTVDGVSYTSPWSGGRIENTSVSLVMPEIQDGYVWSCWLEDGDTNRTKTVTMDTNVTLTGVFTLRSDVNDDGIVNIFDVAIAGAAFGSFPEHPRWNPNADLDNNGIINIFDIAIIAADLGKHI